MNHNFNATSMSEHFIAYTFLEELKPLVYDTKHQNEFSGHFHTEETFEITKKRNKHSLRGQCIRRDSCDHGSCVSRMTITRGNGDSATFFSDISFTYHTHPIYYYTKYGVRIAPPSGEDIGVFLRGCIENKSCAHLVLSREGIYIMYANPCFVEQARNLRKNDETLYQIALVGAEILGMETHEYRNKWTVQQWLDWIRKRFVCRTIMVENYEKDIREKFNYHCEECLDVLENQNIERFQHMFQEIVRNSFNLAQCVRTNPYRGTRWTEGNWIDVEFISWKNAKSQGGITLRY